MAGYSKTPLAKKLGIKVGMIVNLWNAPDTFANNLAPLPDGVKLEKLRASDINLSFIHFFTDSRDELEAHFPMLKHQLAADGTLWVSWPKKASKVATDLDGNLVRELGLATGLVDVKVCAVDEIWSGHKFVYRVKDR